MQVYAVGSRAAGNQISLVPARKVAAGVVLEQRIAVPQRGRNQQKRNGDRDDPDQSAVGPARVQDLRTTNVSPLNIGLVNSLGLVLAPLDYRSTSLLSA